MPSKLKVYSNQICTLGESPLWHTDRESLFWVDIIKQKLYEKKLESSTTNYDKSWDIPYIPSLVIIDGRRTDSILLLTEKGLGRLIYHTGQFELIFPLNLPNNLRTNDGSVCPDGDLWFGTMEKTPTSNAGSIYSLSTKGKLKKQEYNIGIPNTFCWNQNGIFISDSLIQKIYYYHYDKSISQLNRTSTPYIDLTDEIATPDGGTIDNNGDLWNAQWGGNRVSCYDSKGIVKSTIQTPYSPHVTSCCFGGPKYSHLFITTATEGVLNNTNCSSCAGKTLSLIHI